MKLTAIALLTVVVTLAGCASTGSTPAGTNRYAPLPKGTPIAVYAREADVGCAFEPVALVERSDPGKWQVLTLEDAMPYLYEEARRQGANALIIDETTPIKSGLISRGVDVKARAIRTSCALPS